MPPKRLSNTVVGQTPCASLVIILAVGFICVLSLVGTLIKEWLAR
jgi:hypothetical protein